jgi:regulator of replication initiation timing
MKDNIYQKKLQQRRVCIMKDEDIDDMMSQLDYLENVVNDIQRENRALKYENEQLKDEVESLWMMMDEMTKTDIENWTSILQELHIDVASRALMVTKKKADC